MGLNKAWLLEQLKIKNINSEKHVFYAAINAEGKLYISKGKEETKDIHDIRH